MNYIFTSNKQNSLQFEDLKIGDVFRLVHYPNIISMKIHSFSIPNTGAYDLNCIDLSDGTFHSITDFAEVEKYILPIAFRNIGFTNNKE